MTDRQPTETTNLDRYGDPALPWSRAHDILAGGVLGPEFSWFLGTVGPDSRPHAAGVGAVWVEGDIYFVSGPGTRNPVSRARRPAGPRL